ncbi:CorA family divalent cation transporter [Spirulina sp. CS-785/01]|uniref:CorA family divalent cation transporter n=1 Tax=Spirulina sp. CS-785/01 TaxID=3021716 RepID=UPI0023308123|nr:CorA family divalent cation transporter [Spirulina sp. CS-785/01]MDB9311557.1 CorA family divalent cation transporter [Spirulina sp. CS-785/01]
MTHKLPPSWSLPETIKQRFGERSAGKQRAMEAEGHLLLVLHHAPQPHQRDRKIVFFWRKPDGSWEASIGKKGLQPLNKHIKAYNQAEIELQQQYENAQDAEDYFTLLEEMIALRRASKNLHMTLQTAREEIPQDRDIIDLRDWAYEIERSLDLLYENTKNALDFRIAQRAEEQTRLSLKSVESGNRLNILAAIFLPLTALASVFGMNLNSGLEENAILSFWSIFFLGMVFGFFVFRWVTRGRWW